LEKLNFKGSAYQNFGNIYRRLVVPRLVEKSEIIITVSEYEKDTILRKFPNLASDKVKVIYNAVNKQFNTLYHVDELEKFRRELQLPQNFILFLGNTAPKKNTLNVIKAYLAYLVESPSGIPLVILDLSRDAVHSILEKLGKSDLIQHFIFPGYVPSTKMPLLYNLSRLFLYPSIRESFGLPILEAMACGVPVITSKTSSMPEVAGNAALFVDPNRHLEIKEKMTEILQSTSLQSELRARGLKRASEFTWESSARKLIEIYESFAFRS
jgi:glycosyltransferase involved in cell wall biosynthesis